MWATRFFFLAAWVGSLWQLWQALTTGCFHLGKLIATPHCFAQQPFLYFFDLALVLLFVIGLPFLWFNRNAGGDQQQ